MRSPVWNKSSYNIVEKAIEKPKNTTHTGAAFIMFFSQGGYADISI